jgi:transposase-like protein
LDLIVQSRRDKRAAKKFFRKLLKRLRYVPRVMITDRLRSYGALRPKYYPVSNTFSSGIKTTERKIHICRADCETG